MEISLTIQTNECNEYTQSHTACKIGTTVHEGGVSSTNKSTHIAGIADTKLALVAEVAEQERHRLWNKTRKSM